MALGIVQELVEAPVPLPTVAVRTRCESNRLFLPVARPPLAIRALLRLGGPP